MRSSRTSNLLAALSCFGLAATAVIAAAPSARRVESAPGWRYDRETRDRMVNTTGEHNAPAGETLRGAPFIISLSGATLMTIYTTSEGSTHDTGLDLDMNGTIDPGNNPTCDTNDGDIDGDGFFGFVPPPLPLCRPGQLDQLAPGTNGAPGHYWTVIWREQGSVGGIEDLVDSQIGTGDVNSPAPIVPRPGPSNNNPIWVNRNRHRSCDANLGGFDLDCEPFTDTNENGLYDMGEPFTDCNGNMTWDCPDPQPPVQMAISDVRAAQAFAIAPTVTTGTSEIRWDQRPGEPGYGLNPNTDNTGTNTSDQKLRLDSTLGPLGIGVLEDRSVAVGAVSVYANPLLQMESITDVELQWLLVHGRLPDGCDLNFVCRDVNSGTRNTFCNNLLVDVSWGVGEDDGGGPRPLSEQIGTQLRFSDKFSSSAIANTVDSSVFTMGYNSISNGAPDSISNRIDILAVDFTDATGEVGDTLGPILPDVDTIITGDYRIWSRQQYIRVRDGMGGFLGDPDGQVQNYINNLENSTSAFPELGTAFTPADALLANGFVLLDAMDVARTDPDGAPGNVNGDDGDGYTPNPTQDLSIRALLITEANGFYFGTVGPSMVTGNYKFDPDGGGTVDIGDPLNSPDQVGGDFDQDGDRDLDDVDDLVTLILGSPNAGCMPCTNVMSGDCVASIPSYVVAGPNGNFHPYIMGADAVADACLNVDDIRFFCLLNYNGSGHLAKNDCYDRALVAGAGALGLEQHEDIDQNGSVDCNDVAFVNDILCEADAAGFGRSLTINNFDHAFVIGDRLVADQNDDGVINDADLTVVLTAAGLSIADCAATAFNLDGDAPADVDSSDFALFGQCFGGSNNPPAPGCPGGVNADFDGDGDVDTGDFALFATCFAGSGSAPPIGCFCP